MKNLAMMLIIAPITLLISLFAPRPYYLLSAIGLLLMLWLFRSSLKEATAPFKRIGPSKGDRFCLAITDSMGISIRSAEWGEVLRVETGLCERGEIYDGDASADVRRILRERGQDTWARVRYQNGKECWEPVWESKLTDGYWERVI